MENKYNDGIVIEAGVLESYNGNQSILIVPNGVAGVAMCAMMGNRTIHEVRLPDTASLIDDAAFCNCDNLERMKG